MDQGAGVPDPGDPVYSRSFNVVDDIPGTDCEERLGVRSQQQRDRSAPRCALRSCGTATAPPRPGCDQARTAARAGDTRAATGPSGQLRVRLRVHVSHDYPVRGPPTMPTSQVGSDGEVGPMPLRASPTECFAADAPVARHLHVGREDGEQHSGRYQRPDPSAAFVDEQSGTHDLRDAAPAHPEGRVPYDWGADSLIGERKRKWASAATSMTAARSGADCGGPCVAEGPPTSIIRYEPSHRTIQARHPVCGSCDDRPVGPRCSVSRRSPRCAGGATSLGR